FSRRLDHDRPSCRPFDCDIQARQYNTLGAGWLWVRSDRVTLLPLPREILRMPQRVAQSSASTERDSRHIQPSPRVRGFQQKWMGGGLVTAHLGGIGGRGLEENKSRYSNNRAGIPDNPVPA